MTIQKQMKKIWFGAAGEEHLYFALFNLDDLLAIYMKGQQKAKCEPSFARCDSQVEWRMILQFWLNEINTKICIFNII